MQDSTSDAPGQGHTGQTKGPTGHAPLNGIPSTSASSKATRWSASTGFTRWKAKPASSLRALSWSCP